MRSNKLKVI